MQSHDDHITTDEILLYLESPDAHKFRELRAHLINCENCLQATQEISQIEVTIKNSDFTVLPSSIPMSFSHHSEKNALVTPNPLVQKLKKLIQTITNPNYDYKPFFAASSLILVIFLGSTILFEDDKSIIITAYQNSPYVTYQQNSTPGVGFFSSNNVNKVPYPVASFEWLDKTLSVSWEKVEGAISYNLTIESKNSNTSKVILELNSSTNYIEIKNIKILPRVNYQYTISGITQTDLSFTSSGIFVF